VAINRPAGLDPQLLITIFMTDLKTEALPQELFDKFGSDYVYSTGEDPPPLPNAIYMKLDAAKANDGRYVKIPLVKDLSGSPTLGSTGDQRLNEEDLATKYFRMEYTDASHATTNQAYGITARDKFPYKLFEQRVPLMGRYWKQYFGKMRRQALLELQSENLETAPHFLTPGWSPNWYIPGINDSQQPSYHTNVTTWTGRIVTALNLAGTGTSACANVRYFQKLEEWASSEIFIRRITFEQLDGNDGYVVTLPTPQATWMKNHSNTGTMGPIWRDSAYFSDQARMLYPGFLGKLGCLYFWEDQRYPTLTVGGTASGSSGTGTLTAQYRGMGNADDGSSDPRDKTASARQVGFLMGAGALMEWMPEPFHWEWEYEQYDKYFGSGVFLGIGIKQVGFNVGENPDSTTLQQQGSIVLPFAAPPGT